MKRSKVIFNSSQCAALGALIASCALIVLTAGCSPAKVYPTYRYRLKVEIETPDGIKSGESVIAVRTAMTGENSFPTPNTIFKSAQGQAVEVSLGSRGTVFVLLCDGPKITWPVDVMPAMTPYNKRDNKDHRGRQENMFQRMLSRKQRFDLQDRPEGDPRNRPTLVYFDNIQRPETVKIVAWKDLEARFGHGVRVHRVSVQMTDAPVTTGLEKKLHWLPGHQHGLLPYHPIDPKNPHLVPEAWITGLDFTRGLEGVHK